MLNRKTSIFHFNCNWTCNLNLFVCTANVMNMLEFITTVFMDRKFSAILILIHSILLYERKFKKLFKDFIYCSNMFLWYIFDLNVYFLKYLAFFITYIIFTLHQLISTCSSTSLIDDHPTQIRKNQGSKPGRFNDFMT